MIEVQHRVEIDRSPEAVFAQLADVERWPAWQRSVISVSKADDAPLHPGSEFEQTARVMGRTRQVAARVAAYRAPELIAFAGEAPAGAFYCAFDLATDGEGGTIVVARYELRTRGLWNVVRPMIAREFRRATAGEVAGLKRLMEGRRAPTGA